MGLFGKSKKEKEAEYMERFWRSKTAENLKCIADRRYYI